MDDEEDEVHEIGYSRKYDAYYCLDSREWVEPKCSDPTCEFCANRPNKAPPDA